MKKLSLISIVAALSLLIVVSAYAGEKKQYGEGIPADAKTVTLKELINNAQSYKGQLVAVEGYLGDRCSDGEDFFFKDRFDIIEVIPPKGEDLPYAKKKGSRLSVYGKVKVKGGAEEKDKGEERESEVKIEARGVAFK